MLEYPKNNEISSQEPLGQELELFKGKEGIII